MEDLNDHQKQIFNEFKAVVKDCKLIDSSDEYLLKWLLARSFNVEQAEKMLRNHLEWRRLNKVDDILETYTPPEVMNKYFSLGRFGNDKFGCPVYISAHGRTDIKGLMQSTTRKDYMRYQIWTSELAHREMRKENEKTGRKVSSMTYIADADQLSMRQMAYKPAMDAGMEQTKVYEAHYPESVRRFFIINAPKIFTVLFNMMKPLLNQATIDKFRIYGTNKEEWQAALLEEIDADQLPEFFGGTLTNLEKGDPTGFFKFNMGGEVPIEYYLNKTAPEPKDYMETFNIIAGAGGKKKISFKVDKINSIFRWEFMTEGGDLAYRVYLKNPEEGTVDLVPHGRVESNLYIEEGQILCESIGKYVLEFDNTYSIVKMKKIRYFITVDPPSTQFIG